MKLMLRLLAIGALLSLSACAVHVPNAVVVSGDGFYADPAFYGGFHYGHHIYIVDGYVYESPVQYSVRTWIKRRHWYPTQRWSRWKDYRKYHWRKYYYKPYKPRVKKHVYVVPEYRGSRGVIQPNVRYKEPRVVPDSRYKQIMRNSKTWKRMQQQRQLGGGIDWAQ